MKHNFVKKLKKRPFSAFSHFEFRNTLRWDAINAQRWQNKPCR
jgi:hypothetical protein